MAAAAPSPRPTSKPYDADVTIVSAKHLKNVNWRSGDLKPYVSFWINGGRRFSTKSDDYGSTRPVWNERFVVPLTLPPQESVLTLEILHSKPSETAKPLVGTLKLLLKDVTDSDDAPKLRNFELLLPSGRPQGKIRLKLVILERPTPTPQLSSPPISSYYFPQFSDPRDYSPFNPTSYSNPQHYSTPSPPTPLPNPHPYQYSGHSDPYSNYYNTYYSHPPYPPPPRPFLDRQSGYARPGPSAPVDYAPPYENTRGGKLGVGTGLAVGAVAGALGGMTLEEGLKYEEEKKLRESGVSPRDSFSDYRGDY
ncbi:unnamed protein product [Cuscuta campestris]|uniref:C2 domain-containing protein n=2 Tax=Cuscuta sect. Cleistogrammica TaxID=1824901 RepID=A0A484NDI2_9ASTE|nr:hypothetical protein DM860_003859 [Cuscuta australis]VFQ99461.1 unnamed protein product [Cuscuta campestris]